MPFVSTAVEAIKHSKDGQLKKDFLVDILDEHFSDAEAERQFQTLVDWGRYAQLFEYNADEESLLRRRTERRSDATRSGRVY